MPLIDLIATASFPAYRYIAAMQALLENTYGVIHKTNSPVNADSVNFIGAIIDSLAMYLSIATSSNPNPTVPFGNTALQTNSVAYFKEYVTPKAMTLVFSYANNKCPNTNEQLTVRSVATIVPKRMNCIALASLLAETESRTTATKASPLQNLSHQTPCQLHNFYTKGKILRNGPIKLLPHDFRERI